jgi:hypothetical protein
MNDPTRYFIRHPSRMAWTHPTPQDVEELRRDGWSECDESAYRVLVRTGEAPQVVPAGGES